MMPTVPHPSSSSSETHRKPSTVGKAAGRSGWSLALVLGWTLAVGQSPLNQVLPGAPRPASSQGQSGVNSGGPEAAAQIAETRLAEARAELATFSASSLTNVPAGASPQDVWFRRAALGRLVRLYEQQSSHAATLQKVQTRKADIAREAQAWTRFPDPPPYPVLLVDRLREETQAEHQRIRSGEAASRVLSQLTEDNRGALTQADEKLRQLHEQLESAADPTLAARLVWQRDQERLRSHLAAASVASLDLERQINQETLDGSRLRLGLLQRQLVVAGAATTFTQADLDQVTGQIDGRREQLERELAETQARQIAAKEALDRAREASREAQSLPSGGAAASQALELVSTREAQLDAADTAIQVLRVLLEGASTERSMWEMRFAAHANPSLDTLRASERRLETFTRRLHLWREYARQQMDGLASQIQLQEAGLNSLSPGTTAEALARDRLNACREQESMLLRLVRAVERTEHLTARWAEGLQTVEKGLPLTSRIRHVFSDTQSFLQRIWDFEVFTAEDSITVDGQRITGQRRVTVGKITMAILILVVGYWITGLVTALVEPFIVKRLRIETNQANLIRRWLRAFLVVCLLLFSLVSVKIPLTVFAFAGGALAIGLGFGTQTLLKNFISGLILLFERPFRVGDVLDVDGQKGTVTGIGLRASVIQLWDGTETLIPNSSLLENNVTNWTYTSPRVRFIVTVGVAYGSDPRRVIQLLHEAADRHGLVEKDPKPQVLFTQFGESTLDFELRYWVDFLKTNSAQVASDLRLMIANSFAENAIAIAYPQRDLHLHADRPIPVRLVSPPEAQAQAAPHPQPPAAPTLPPALP